MIEGLVILAYMTAVFALLSAAGWVICKVMDKIWKDKEWYDGHQ